MKCWHIATNISTTTLLIKRERERDPTISRPAILQVKLMFNLLVLLTYIDLAERRIIRSKTQMLRYDILVTCIRYCVLYHH